MDSFSLTMNMCYSSTAHLNSISHFNITGTNCPWLTVKA